MIENELLFLGLLADGPKHGYEIKRQIEKELEPVIGLKIKSIYYPLQKMEEEGLIEKHVGRKGNFPQKYSYQITPKGRKQFEELISKSFVSVDRPYFQMNLSLYFLPLIDPSSAKKRLKARMILLKRIQKRLLVIKGNFSPTKSLELILSHDLDLVNAEIIATENIIKKI